MPVVPHPAGGLTTSTESWFQFLKTVAALNDNCGVADSEASEGVIGVCILVNAKGGPPVVMSNVPPEIRDDLILFILQHAASVHETWYDNELKN